MVKFPTLINDKLFLLGMIALYALFMLDMSNYYSTFRLDLVLFANDLNEEGVLPWLINQASWSLFQIVISYHACVDAQTKLRKSIYFAIYIDGILTLCNAIFFGYSEHVAAPIIRNLFVIISFLTAYFYSPKNGNSKTTRTTTP